MRFVDEVEIDVVSGRGGKGSSSFRREKYVPHGGPDGGDGGRGGDVVLVADEGLGSLLDFRSRAMWKAGDGTKGDFRQMTGAVGADIVIKVPVGTEVIDAVEGHLLCELLKHGESRVVAAGGKGGLGNIHFKSSTNRAPKETGPPGPGETRRIRLELKLVADVGLLGFPNAGKSTLISVISAARPKIADYPFTTLVPNLGVVSAGDGQTFVVADIPGLIEGAAEGKGLGLQFLRHVERTRLLLHLISLAEAGDPVARWRILRDELRRYDESMVRRPEIVVLSQIDAIDADQLAQVRADFAAAGVAETTPISAVTGQGVAGLVQQTWAQLRELALPPRV